MGFEHHAETKANTGGGGGGAARFTFVSTPKAVLGAALGFQDRPMGPPVHLIVDSLNTTDCLNQHCLRYTRWNVPGATRG